MLIVTDTASWGHHEARAVNTCYHALIAGCVSGRIQFKEVSSLRLVLAVHESGCGLGCVKSRTDAMIFFELAGITLPLPLIGRADEVIE